MKKVIFAFAIFLSAVTAVSAQKDFRIGLKGGLNISQFDKEHIFEKYVTAGYHIGVFVRLPITDRLSFQPEAQYSIKGSTFNEAIGNELSKATIRLSYIDAIGLMNLRLAPLLNLQGGLVLGILTDSGVKNKGGGDNNLNPEEAIEQNDFRLFDPGYTFGLEADLAKWVVGARYTQGLRNISNTITYDGTTYSFPELRNTVYQVYVGIRFM